MDQELFGPPSSARVTTRDISSLAAEARDAEDIVWSGTEYLHRNHAFLNNFLGITTTKVFVYFSVDWLTI
jgi:hypothetical protein